jgi:peptide/nickel transport system substrate-binding protein
MGLLANRHGKREPVFNRSGITRREALALTAFGFAVTRGSAFAAGPDGQLTWGIHVSLAPTWFDPADTQGIITPFMVLYALHDAVVKPMPGQPMAPSLAQSWTASEDGLTYEFALRENAKFHNGEPVTAEDVKFSFERYRGASHDLIKDRVAAVETPDPRRVRFRLKAPWSDFLTFYATASGAGWVVPKKYAEQVGDEGFKKAPVGAGPYKFVSFTPGVELVFEAFDQYWRKTPSIKRLVFKVIPDETTRLAALQRAEIDIVYSIRGELAEELKRTPGLTLKPVVPQARGGFTFPSNGTRNHLGMMSGYDARPAWQSTGKGSTRRSPSATRRSPAASSLTPSTIFGSRRNRPTIRPKPSSFSLKPAMLTASMPASITSTRPIQILVRRCSTTS